MCASERKRESDDVELVAACRNGDSEAFEALVLRHQKPMLNLAYRVLGNYEEACEVVQDAFVAAYKGLSAFRGEARFSTWLASITLNHARNGLVRLTARRKREGRSLDAGFDGDDERPPNEPASPARSALETLEDEAVRRQIEKCIASLPVEFREVLVLRDLQDHSYEEIGTVLKVRAGTVKSRLFRARDGVKECLKRAMGVPA
jgi:RNA polymerase sigma-70 factor (ECF subfamily)